MNDKMPKHYSVLMWAVINNSYFSVDYFLLLNISGEIEIAQYDPIVSADVLS